MIFAGDRPLRPGGLGVLDYTCENGVCSPDTSSKREIFRGIQNELNRFVGYALVEPLVSDGVMGPATVDALIMVTLKLDARGTAGPLNEIVPAVKKGYVDSAWIATRAGWILELLRWAAAINYRPTALVALQQAEGPVRSGLEPLAITQRRQRRWPWIVGGVAVLLAGGVIVHLALRKKRRN